MLPVLSLKVLSFVRHANEEAAGPWRHGVAYTAGVVGFVPGAGGGLAGFLRAGRRADRWGFQLQSPGLSLAALVGACSS